MKHVFIVNNTAGGGKSTMPLIPQIEAYFAENGGDYEIASTTCKGDATQIAKRFASMGEPVRIYACGGDGTLHEVVNGVVGYKNAEVGVFPCGTGNDYVATFGTKEEFMDIEGQIKGSSIEVDLICTDGMYSVNQCSMGFDAAVADNVVKFKRKPLVSGSMAYLLSVIYTLAGKMGNELTITIDDNETITGRFLFAISAKGNYHGGGMMSAPAAKPDSRSLNFVIVRAVTRTKLLSLLPKYIKGEHLSPKYSDIIYNTYGKKMHIVAKKPLPVTLDGEIIITEEMTSEIVQKGMRFILPRKVAVKNEQAEPTVKVYAVNKK
ncbi:MAG: diacylglycerol kinase family lipid kinase [Clostridia bacterium]|nr:diacylglycerol kinase family lipid kinase [Clostridia bacterium]